jgi:hypothetical protein
MRLSSSVLTCSCLLLVTPVSVAANSLKTPPPDLRAGGQSSKVPTCDAMYVGPPGGAWEQNDNWTMGLPRAGDVACIPDDMFKSFRPDLPFTVRIIQRAKRSKQPMSGLLTRPTKTSPPVSRRTRAETSPLPGGD